MSSLKFNIPISALALAGFVPSKQIDTDDGNRDDFNRHLSINENTMTDDHRNAAINYLTIQSNQEQKNIEQDNAPKVIVKNAPKPISAAKKKQLKAEGFSGLLEDEDDEPVKPSPTNLAPGLLLPEVGTVAARDLLKLLNKATCRNEKILAIAGFSGYDPKKEFGAQEMTARFLAKSALNPVSIVGLTRDEVKLRDKIAPGFVPGTPNFQEKKLLDLQARAALIEEQMNHFLKVSKDPIFAESERKLKLGLAMVEKERLMNIQAEITELKSNRRSSN